MSVPVLETPAEMAKRMRRNEGAMLHERGDGHAYEQGARDGITAAYQTVTEALAACFVPGDDAATVRNIRDTFDLQRGGPKCTCGEIMTERRTWSQGRVTRRAWVCLSCENADLTRLARTAGK